MMQVGEDGKDREDPATPEPAEDALPAAGTPARPRPARLAAFSAIAAVVAAGIAFGVTSALRGPGEPADAVIPVPPASNQAFVPDGNGTFEDNLQNGIAVTGPGLVHILGANGQPAGLGIVVTKSGKVLTAAQVIGGSKSFSVRYVRSGKSYPATVIGSDAGADVALLQLKGGTNFPVAQVGTSRGLHLEESDSALGSPGTGKSVNFNLGFLDDVHGTATIDGARLTGLLHESAQVVLAPAAYAGGPLVNLTGHVIGIEVKVTRLKAGADVLAIPINTALAVAEQIDNSHG